MNGSACLMKTEGDTSFSSLTYPLYAVTPLLQGQLHKHVDTITNLSVTGFKSCGGHAYREQKQLQISVVRQFFYPT